MHTAVETMVDSSAAQVGILRIGWEVSKGGTGGGYWFFRISNESEWPGFFFNPLLKPDYSANEGAPEGGRGGGRGRWIIGRG